MQASVAGCSVKVCSVCICPLVNGKFMEILLAYAKRARASIAHLVYDLVVAGEMDEQAHI